MSDEDRAAELRRRADAYAALLITGEEDVVQTDDGRRDVVARVREMLSMAFLTGFSAALEDVNVRRTLRMGRTRK